MIQSQGWLKVSVFMIVCLLKVGQSACSVMVIESVLFEHSLVVHVAKQTARRPLEHNPSTVNIMHIRESKRKASHFSSWHRTSGFLAALKQKWRKFVSQGHSLVKEIKCVVGKKKVERREMGIRPSFILFCPLSPHFSEWSARDPEQRLAVRVGGGDIRGGAPVAVDERRRGLEGGDELRPPAAALRPRAAERCPPDEPHLCGRAARRHPGEERGEEHRLSLQGLPRRRRKVSACSFSFWRVHRQKRGKMNA